MITSIGKTFGYHYCADHEVLDSLDGYHDHIHANSITFAPQYRTLSFEELRFNDIRHADHVANILVRTSLDSSTSGVEQHSRRATVRKGHYGSSMVTFRVGTGETQDFTIHENLVAAASDFVALTMKSDWKETQARLIPLPEDQPEIFEIYQQWLYLEKICTASYYDPKTDQNEYRVLVDAYIFGDKLLDTHFKDAITDCIIDKLLKTQLFDTSLVKVIYSKTTPSAPLRRLLVDVYGWNSTKDWVHNIPTDDPAQAEFMKDLLKLHETEPWQSDQPAPFLVPGHSCLYHEHVKGTCYKAQDQTTTTVLPSKASPYRKSPFKLKPGPARPFSRQAISRQP